MRKPGKRSRERDAYFFSDRKGEKDKYFFMVLLGDFRERLAIPEKFMQHFRALKANIVKLVSRCGHTFDVEVAKNLGKLVLRVGWKEFVTAHDLNMGDFLVFKYDGTSRFKVLIFDLSCCEKVPVKRNQICGRETRGMHIEISSSCADPPRIVTTSSATSLSASSGDSLCLEDQKSHCVPGDKYFLKVLVGDFRDRLAIPDKFMQHFRTLLANSVTLETHCGHRFDVQVAKNLGKVILQTGWKALVTAHDLNMGDFLVFKYDGTSQLKVLIFDLSCCEKVPPCLVKRNCICGRETREMHIKISSSCGDLPMNFPVSSSTSLSDSHSSGYILPQGTRLTSLQMKKLKERIRASNSTIPIYGCLMKKSNLRRGKSQSMDIPRVYADVYLPFEKQTLMLQCCGKSWEVRCMFSQKRRTRYLSQGWKQFARDNKLQLGDLCLFELLENTKYTMNVHIIRAE